MTLVFLLYFPLVRLVHLVELVSMRLLLLQDLLVLPLDLLHDHLPLLRDLLLKVVLGEEVIELLQNCLDKREIRLERIVLKR